jgi:D-arabinose 1-dehydrogenase-like Zn-dependent alcohol dehydrogenase
MLQLGVHEAGSMAEYMLAPATKAYSLPKAMPFEHAAFI